MTTRGARILEAKIAASPSDIDVIGSMDMGWPIYRGGRVLADQSGLKHIADRLQFYAKETNDPDTRNQRRCSSSWRPKGKTFASLAARRESGI